MSRKNIALIFAGGTGTRMNCDGIPKQFLELHGKAIIIHTLEIFEKHPDIDGIVVVCIETWIDRLISLIEKHRIMKVIDIVSGGSTGQMSIFNGLQSIVKHASRDSVVLIHDGVRPLITQETITDNIEHVKKHGSAITTSPPVETFVLVDDGLRVTDIPQRRYSRLAKAPQSFVLGDIYDVHLQAKSDNVLDSVDSCTLMSRYGREVCLVEGPTDNIKITTPTDYYIFRAIYEARENSQIFGIR